VPSIKVNGATLHYDEQGTAAETVVFAHGLLWSGTIFAQQVRALRGRYRCITFDFRGHGRSEVTQGGYDMDALCEDAAALIEHLHAAPCHFVGHSMGTFVAMRLAIRRPELLRSLTLLAASPDAEPWGSGVRYRLLGVIYRWFGLGPVAHQLMPVLFGQTLLRDPQRAALRAECRAQVAANDRVGIGRAIGAVVRRAGVYDRLPGIGVPTLVITGEEDVAAPPAMAERIHARIPGSVLRIIPRAGHTATLEEPEAMSRELAAFLAGVPAGRS
jgi:pimeloyl-ACP methyl ester carboxylesterase